MAQRIDVVYDLQKTAARGALIERLPDRVIPGTPRSTPENSVVIAHRFAILHWDVRS